MSDTEILSKEEVERGATLDCEMGRATFAALNAALVKVERARARQARALKWYANKKNWSEDDWGCLAVVDPPDYADAGGKARRCLAATQKAADAAVAKVKKEGWCGDE